MIIGSSKGSRPMTPLYTIGFTQKSASRFFELLRGAGVKTVVDTRLNNTGQLAGFAKREDLAYFLNTILGVKYVHWLDSAPTDDLLIAYKKKQMTWDQYELEYRNLIEKRRLEDSETAHSLDASCLLCSEAKPHRCHRRILAEYLVNKLPGKFSIEHLG